MAHDPVECGYRHGPQGCRACFDAREWPWHSDKSKGFPEPDGRWQLRPNPGYWGATEPEVVVLGFSKGPGQNRIIDDYLAGKVPWEAIPFNDGNNVMRPNLGRMLATLGLVPAKVEMSSLFKRPRPSEGLPAPNCKPAWGFSSLVRCSVEVWHKVGYVGTRGNILTRTIKARPAFVGTCTRLFLNDHLPRSVRLILLLGANKRYVTGVRKLLGGDPLFPLSDVAYAYRMRQVYIAHLPHPSGLNTGSVNIFCGEEADPRSGNMVACRLQALEAVRLAFRGPEPEPG